MRPSVNISVDYLHPVFDWMGRLSYGDFRIALQLLNGTQRQLLKREVFDWMVYL